MLKMKQRPRIYYSSEQRNLMWDRWQKGDSMHAIARLFDRGHSSVQGIEATGRNVELPFVAFYHFDETDKLISERLVMNLGVLVASA